MTEPQNASAKVEETGNAVETTPLPEKAEKKSTGNRVSLMLSILAIAIALAVAAGSYSRIKQQAFMQTAASDALSRQLTALEKARQTQKAALESLIGQLATQRTQMNHQQEALVKQLGEIQQKVATLSGGDTNSWLLAQADFLVKLAARKLWSDQDVITAVFALKSADASLAQMHDPGLISARRAITDDIASLSAMTQVDYDGIILKLNQLSSQIDNLRLADNSHDGSPMDADSNELSTSLREWRINLQKSWRSFMDSFITLRRRDETAIPLLAPDQDIYLRENIRSRLLVAAQAVPRHQEQTYQQALDNVSTWVRAYYDSDDAATQAFLAEVDELNHQSISMTIPDQLQSQPVLEKLMQNRVRRLLAQPAAPETTAQGE